jgi:glycosyltransferase involved in cell wall biosynthesis
VNQRALFSFADEIWPKVDRRCRRRLRVVFAGGVPDEQVLRRVRRAGIEVRPSPSSAELANLFSQAGVQLCPVTSGTGIKIKTLEAMAYGKGVVGYPSAFRGISAEHQRHALIAESAEQSAELLELSLSDDRLRRRLGEAAQGLVRDAFDPPKLGTRLVEAYATVHARGPRIDAPTAEDPSLLSTAGLA